jgi:hypothetical protein
VIVGGIGIGGCASSRGRAPRFRACAAAKEDPDASSAIDPDEYYDEGDEGDSGTSSGSPTSAILKKALAIAAEEDNAMDVDIDDEELAALEALDRINGGADEDDADGGGDGDTRATAKFAQAAEGDDWDDALDVAEGGEEETAGSYDGEVGEEGEEGEDDEEDEEGVALLRELFEYGGVAVSEWVSLGEDEDVEVSGIANDSRVVLGGDVFVCIVGATVDGHDFALDAIAAGAVAVVCSRPIPGLSEDTPQVIVPDTSAALPRLAAAFYGNPSTALTTVGVTGTNGKTTTTYLVRAIMEAAGMPCGVIGTVGYALQDIRLTPHGGVWEPHQRDPTATRSSTSPGWLAPYRGKYEVPHTTPDALQCQQLLAGMLDNGATAAVMEVSSHALAQGRVDCTDFDVAVFTNLSHDHLDFHGSMAAYREAKAELFRRLSDPERQRAVINIDAWRDPDDRYADDDEKTLQARRKKGEAPGEEDADYDNAAYFVAAAGGGERVPIITYATHRDKAEEADVFVERAVLTLFETSVRIRTPVGSFDAVCGMVIKGPLH